MRSVTGRVLRVSGARGEERFSERSAARALSLACADLGLDGREARLARLGENAIYVLPYERIVVRIARSIELRARVQREVDVACWLATQGFPAARVAESMAQPYEVDGRLATFWTLIHVSGEKPHFAELGGGLRELHSLPPPPFALPVFDPFSVVPRRLADPGDADPAHVAFLTGLYESLRDAYTALDFPTAFGLIHGDAHLGNLLRENGRPVLMDFEVVGHGPREWDLTPTALSVERFGIARPLYESFVAAYGADVTRWSGYRVLRAIRELTMTTWLMQNIGLGPEHAKEFDLRVESLREGDHVRRWRVF